jgi:RimJ/RimL family protein N-acetyltransferase
MTKDVMRKVLERAQELRREKGRWADKIKRFVWMALKDNPASAKAALKTGFKEQPSSQADSRKFTMSRREAERMTQEDK